jgi:hypothetical protein
MEYKMSNEVVCLNLSYDDSNDMLLWTIKFLHNEEVMNIASPAASFADAVGIKGKINKEDWEEFCIKMKNKKCNFVLPKE